MALIAKIRVDGKLPTLNLKLLRSATFALGPIVPLLEPPPSSVLTSLDSTFILNSTGVFSLVLNDHVIVFTLESISLKGPANRDPMEAFEFGTSVVNGTLNWEIIQNCNGYDLIPVHVLQPY